MNSHYKILLFIALVITACIEPYEAVVGDNGKLLVVDALITNAEGPYYVSLNLSAPNTIESYTHVSDATVSLKDNHDNEYLLNHINEGVYQTPLEFRGVEGNSYQLYINYKSKKYESEWCVLKKAACIDKFYFDATTQTGSTTESKVLTFKVNASACSNEETFLRWDVKEDWQFYLSSPENLEMIDDYTYIPLTDFESTCYTSNKTRGIVTHSFQNQNTNNILDKEIYSVSSKSSDRFSVRYRATINQYSISQNEYTFWNKLKETTEETNDFFGKQPYSVNGNITCLSNPDEKVLGFFQVAGVSSKDIYLTRKDIADLNLPSPSYGFRACSFDTVHISDEYTLYEKYLSIISGGRLVFSRPFYIGDAMPELGGILFVPAKCARCSANDSKSIPPEGWIE